MLYRAGRKGVNCKRGFIMPRKYRRIIEERSIPEPNSGCWIWLGSFNRWGYGTGLHKSEYAHKRSWREYNGPVPAGLWVLHRCDNPACVNPDHLFLGTGKDNVRDKVSKGRARGAGRGEAHWKNTLTKNQVMEIMSDTRPQSVIAAEYGVRQQAISKIKRKQTWAHLWSNEVLAPSSRRTYS